MTLADRVAGQSQAQAQLDLQPLAASAPSTCKASLFSPEAKDQHGGTEGQRSF